MPVAWLLTMVLLSSSSVGEEMRKGESGWKVSTWRFDVSNELPMFEPLTLTTVGLSASTGDWNPASDISLWSDPDVSPLAVDSESALSAEAMVAASIGSHGNLQARVAQVTSVSTHITGAGSTSVSVDDPDDEALHRSYAVMTILLLLAGGVGCLQLAR